MDLFSPAMGGFMNFGMNILSTSAQKTGAYRQAWAKWEADSRNAIRKKLETDKQNFRQHTVDQKNYLKTSQYVSDLRQYENKLKSNAAKLKTETSINATEALGKEYADLNARFYEEEAADTDGDGGNVRRNQRQVTVLSVRVLHINKSNPRKRCCLSFVY